MSAIGPRTYRGSCIYHGPKGCSLTRELRADLCNNFHCEAMSRFRAGMAEANSASIFTVSRDACGRERGRFIAEEDRSADPFLQP